MSSLYTQLHSTAQYDNTVQLNIINIVSTQVHKVMDVLDLIRGRQLWYPSRLGTMMNKNCLFNLLSETVRWSFPLSVDPPSHD